MEMTDELIVVRVIKKSFSDLGEVHCLDHGDSIRMIIYGQSLTYNYDFREENLLKWFGKNGNWHKVVEGIKHEFANSRKRF